MSRYTVGHAIPDGAAVWQIEVYGYGSFLFVGTETEAEEMRRHKAGWERGVGRKRLALAAEIASGEAKDDMKHPETV